MPTVHVIYASTSGHTEYVVGVAVDAIKKARPDLAITVQRAEQAQADDVLRGDVLILASGSWNTGGQEGQLNPHMHYYFLTRAQNADLQNKPVFCIGLGDERYHFTARALHLLEDYVKAHNGTLLAPSLKIVNEPYGQEGSVEHWVEHVLPSLPQ